MCRINACQVTDQGLPSMTLLFGGTDVLVCLYTVPLYSELERPWSPRAPQFKNEKNDLTTQVAILQVVSHPVSA